MKTPRPIIILLALLILTACGYPQSQITNELRNSCRMVAVIPPNDRIFLCRLAGRDCIIAENFEAISVWCPDQESQQ